MPLTMHHIPICPFSQRLEILMALKGLTGAVDFHTVDITTPRDPRLLELTGGTTALPVLELEDGRALKESLVLLHYLEDRFPDPAVRREDPYERGVENLMVSLEGPFVDAGYRLVLNQDLSRRDALVDAYLARHAELDAFLRRHATADGPWLFDRFGWAETVFTPFFRRWAFVRYYEDVDLPADPAYERVRSWREACLAHPAAQQVSDEAVIKLYYDYARGLGNGAVGEGRTRSSFVLDPPWQDRPWPPKDTYDRMATDAELGLV